MSKKTTAIYNALSASGDFKGSEQDFNKKFFAPGTAGYEYRKGIFNTLKQGGADVGANYEEFGERLGLRAVPRKAKAQQPKPQNAQPPMSDAEKRAMIGTTADMVAQTGQQIAQTGRAIEHAKRHAGLDVRTPRLGQNRNVDKVEDPVSGQVQYETEDGQRYDNEAYATQAQNEYDQAKQYAGESELDRELREARQQQADLEDALRKRREELDNGGKGFFGKMLESAAQATRPDVAMHHNNVSDYEQDEEYGQLMAAVRQNRGAIQVLEDKKNNKMNSFWHSFATTAANGYTFGDGRAELNDAIALTNAQRRLAQINAKRERGEMLTREEESAEQVLTATLRNQAMQGKYGDGYGGWAVAGAGVPVSLDMMKDMLLGGGIFQDVSKGVAKGIAKAGLRQVAKASTKGLLKGAARTAAKGLVKATGVTLGSLAGGALVTNTTGLTKTLGEAAKGATGNVGLDKHGHFQFENQKGLMSALAEAERSQIGENASEMFGEFIPEIGIGKLAIRGLEKIGLSKMAGFLTSMGGKQWAKQYAQVLRASGFNGMPNEALEEYAGILYNQLTGDSDNGLKTLADLRTHRDIWLGTATVGALMGAPNVVMAGAGAAQYYRYKHAMERSAKVANYRLTEEKWKPLQEAIDNTPNEGLTDLLMDIYGRKDMELPEKKAVYDYIHNLVKYRGYNIGTINFNDSRKQEGDPKQDADMAIEGAADQAYTDGYNAQGVDMARAKREYDNATRRVVEVLGGDVVDMLSSDPVLALKKLHNDGALEDDATRDAATAFVNAKMKYDGVIQRAKDDLDGLITDARNAVEQRTHQDGAIHPATLKEDGKRVYIVDGNVSMLEDGSAVDTQNSDDTIIIRGEDGKLEFTSPSAIMSVGDLIDPAQERDMAEQAITQGFGTRRAAEIDGVDENGQPIPLDGENATPTAEAAATEGQQGQAVPEQGETPIANGGQQAQEEPQQQQATTATLPETQGVQQTQTTPAETAAATPTPTDAATQAEQGGEQLLQETQQLPQLPQEQAAEPMPMVKNKEGEEEPDFYATTPQRGHQYIYDEAELPREVADEFVANNAKAAQAELEKVKKKQPKMGTSIAKYKAEQAAYQGQVQAAEAAVKYWEDVKAEQAAIRNAEAKERQAKQAAETEAAQKAEAERQAAEIAKRKEQEERGANNVHPKVREKWDNAPKVEGAEDEITLPNGERVKGRYVLVESGAATPSHDATREFAKSEGFPVDENGQSVNDRDYERDKDAQSVTRRIAGKYDGRALQNPVVVSRDGIVLSGNGRTMAGELAARDNTDGAYFEHLAKYPHKYGFTQEQVSTMKHPRVVFMADEAMPYTAETFSKFNQQEMKGQSKTEQSVKMGKVVPDDVFARIVKSINGHDTLAEFYADTKAAYDAILELQAAGVITEVQMAEMLDGDGVSAQGRELLENMLIGKAFEGNPDAIRQLTEYKGMRQSVVTALAEIANNVALGEDYSLGTEIAAAISLAYQARKAGYKAGDRVSQFARQMNLFPFEDGATVADYTNATLLMLADVLNDNRTTLLKKMLAVYNNRAQDNANGQLDLFSGGRKTKEEIINEVKQLIYNGTEQEQQDAIGRAVESRKESVQQNGSAERSDKGNEQERGRGIDGKQDAAKNDEVSEHDASETESRPKEISQEEKTEKIDGDRTDSGKGKPSGKGSDSGVESGAGTAHTRKRPKADEKGIDEKEVKARNKKTANNVTEQKTPPKNEGQLGLVSDERMAELKERLKRKLRGQLNVGIDPEILAIGIELAAGHIDRVVKAFSDFAKAMIKDMGDVVRPYLKAFYEGAKNMPELEHIASELTPTEEVRAFNVATIDNEGNEVHPNIIATAEQVDNEATVENEEKRASKEATEVEDVDTGAYSITKQHHDKKGTDIWVVRAKERTDAAVYAHRKQLAKENNGYYSSFRGVNGFVFNTPEEARAFADDAFNEDVVSQTETGVGNETEQTANEPKEEEVEDTHGYKIGDKVLYKGKEATIYEFDHGRPVLDAGQAPIVYELAHFEDISPLDRTDVTKQENNEHDDKQKTDVAEKSEPKETPSKEKGVTLEQPALGNLFDESNSNKKGDENNQGTGTEDRKGERGVQAREPNRSGTDDNEQLERGIQVDRNDRQGHSGVSRADEEVRTSIERPGGRVSQLGQGKNANNNHSERGVDYAPKSVNARIEANLAAIELSRSLVESGEKATPEQMAVLRKFSGWGGLGKAFTEPEIAARIKSVIGETAYAETNMSRNSAYYTPAHVVDTLWEVAKKLGFKGGKILEGSAGIGNILGLMPRDISENSDIHAIEVDSTTGNILALLYPDAKVDIKGFEDTSIPNNSVDLAITNVPFVTGLSVIDTTGDIDLSKKFKSIQDFAIAKNVRKLRQGGIGIFITSNGTLDNNRKLYQWLTNDGDSDVVGAFRMNNKTFVGASVTTDIIVVRKRVNGQKSPNAIDLGSSRAQRVVTYDTGNITKKGNPITQELSLDYNAYFMEHPENMGGEMAFAFEHGDRYHPTSKGLYPSKDIDQDTRMREWVQSLGAKEEQKSDITQYEEQPTYKELGEDVKEGSLILEKDGTFSIAQKGVAVPLNINDKKVRGRSKQECYDDYQKLKSAVRDVLEYQNTHETDEGLQSLLDKLNKAFDTFVSKYGNLHKNTSISFLKNDVDFTNIQSLQTYKRRGDKNGKIIEEVGKSDVFKGRVIEKAIEPTPKTVKDAVVASLYKHGDVDVAYMAAVLGENEERIKEQVVRDGLAFEDPITGKMKVSYEYLSGNVREKLKSAKANNEDGKYDANIKALEKVIPADIPPHLIEFTLGSSWIKPSIYEEYIKERTGMNVILSNVDGTWLMEDNGGVHYEKDMAFGVRSELLNKVISGTELIRAALQNRSITVASTSKRGGVEERLVDKEATAACAAKIDEIRQDFRDWAKDKVQKDEVLAEEIGTFYNEKFNNQVPFEIPEEFVPLHFAGANNKIMLYDHQKKAVVRALSAPTLFAHEVGTGKTFTMITTAMEMRRLGTAKKPMIVVQNATVGQFVEEAKELYPNAKVLSIEPKDRTKEGRKAFYAKIKYNDWDLVIIPQSVFERIPDSKEREANYIQDKIDEKMHVLEVLANSHSKEAAEFARKIDAERKALEEGLALINAQSIEKRRVRDEKKAAVTKQNAEVRAKEALLRAIDDVEDFDEMGVDALFIDEAHEYKHLGFATAMQRGVKGVDPSYSKKAQSAYLKVQSVLERNNGKNVVFATGTPISNTAAEVWTFMRYLMPAETMKDYDIYYFDDFVRNFGNLQQMLEFTTSGKFKENNRFAGYMNLPELIRIWFSVADTVRTKDAGKVSEKVPETELGKETPQDIYLPQTKALRAVMKHVNRELEAYEKMSGKEKKENSHIPLVMYGIAKQAAIDARLVVNDAVDDPNSKTNEAVRQTLRTLEETKGYDGTVAIFADNYQNKNNGFNLYEDIKKKLVEQGVPETKVAIIRSDMSVAKKLEIFDKVNSGEIRVIMGSTATLGTGVNIQERLHTLIHIDAPNRPMDYTQRNGRILRQGNIHKDMGKPVRILRFGVEDSLDVTAYQRLKTKGAIAESVMNGKQMITNSMDNRMLEEADDVFGDIIAQLSGSEYAMLKNQAEKEVRKFEAKRKQWEADQAYIHIQMPKLRGLIEDRKARIRKAEQSLGLIKANGNNATITVGKHKFNSLTDMADFIKDYNKKTKEIEDRARNNDGHNEKRELDIVVGNIPFVVTSRITSGIRNRDGSLFTETSRIMTYSSDTLGLESVPVKQGYLKNALTDILENVMSGNDFKEAIERDTIANERDMANLKTLSERDGKPFEFAAELKNAKGRLSDYTEKMKEELAEKEAKYKDVDSEVQEISDVIYNNEEENEDDAKSTDDAPLFRMSEETGSDSAAMYRLLNSLATEDNLTLEDVLVPSSSVRMPRKPRHRVKQWLNGKPIDEGNISAVKRLLHDDNELRDSYTYLREIKRTVDFSDYYDGTETTFKIAPAVQVRLEGLSHLQRLLKEGEVSYRLWQEMKQDESLEWHQSPLSSSEYLINKETGDIYRYANHWGRVASCIWNLDDEIPGSYQIGVSNIKDFKAKPYGRIKFLNASYLRSIKQTSVNIKNVLNDEEIDISPDAREKLEDYLQETLSQENELLRDNAKVILDDRGFAEKAERKESPVKPREEENQAGRSREAYAEQKVREMETAVKETAAKMNLGNVVVLPSADGLTGQKARAKGWFDRRTGKITIVLGNHTSVEDAIKTLMHEAVAHYGLRKLFGKDFDTFLDNVYRNAPPSIRRKIVQMSIRHGWDVRVATEEYLASLAEDTDFEQAKESGWFQKVKEFFINMLRRLTEPYKLIDIGENELRYILWRSYENLTKQGQGIIGEAQDVVKREELLGNTRRADEPDILFRKAEQDKLDFDKAVARERYEQRMKKGGVQTTEAMQDSMKSLMELYKAVDEAEKVKREVEDIPDNENAYVGENRLSSVNQAELDDFNRRFFKPLLDSIAALARTDAERQELFDYMMAKHGLERNKKMAGEAAFKEFEQKEAAAKLIGAEGPDWETIHAKHRKRDYSGLTSLMLNPTETEIDTATAEQRAQQLVDDYEKNAGKTKIDNLWYYTKQANNEVLWKMYRGGLISRKVYEENNGIYSYYIPLRGFDEKTSGEEYAYLMGKDSAFTAPMKKAKGRTSKADNPIAQMALMADGAIMQANRNRLVKQPFLNYVTNHPSDLVSVSELWLEYDEANDMWKPKFPDIKPEDTPEEVEDKVEKFEEMMQALAQSEPGRYKKQSEAKDIPYRVLGNDVREHQVIVKRNGKAIVLTINGNPRAAQAINGLTNPDSKATSSIDHVFDKIAKANRWLSAAYTTRNPDFVVSNFIRDTFYANVMVHVKENMAYAAKFHVNHGVCNPIMIGRLLHKYNNGTLDMDNELQRYFYEFMTNGGETGWTSVMNAEQHKKDIKKRLDRGAAGKAWDGFVDSMEFMNRAIENSARFAAFVTSRQVGRQLGRSIYDAKEISVNFNKKGSGSKTLGVTGQTWAGNTAAFTSGLGRGLYTFWNASIQGLTNYLRYTKRNPAKGGTLATMMFGLGLLMPYIGYVMGGGDDNDDGNGYYDIPEYTRRSNILVRMGDGWAKIALPQEYKAIYGLGEIAMSAMMHQDQDTAGERILDAAAQLSQVLPIDFMEGGGSWTAVVPTTLKPVVEAMRNKSWTGLPIYKDTPYNKDDPEWKKAFKGSNKLMVAGAKSLSDITGGDDYKAGAVDINPAALEHVLKGNLGGMYEFPNKLYKTIMMAFGDQPAEARNMILVNRVYENGSEQTKLRALNNAFFKYKEEYEKTKKLMRNYEREAEDGSVEYMRKIDLLKHTAEYARYLIFDEYRKDLDMLNNDRKEARGDDKATLAIDKDIADLRKEVVHELRQVGRE